MLNKEKYAKEILGVACRGESFALVDNKIIPCNKTNCRSCYFYYVSECGLNKEKWANSEYIKPLVVWSKVAVDTPVLVRDDKKDRWRKRYFAKYENKHVYVWANGSTSWSTDYKKDIKCWQYTKLAEE